MSEKVKREVPASRAYDSPVRRARAQETERRVLTAATAVFAELGYVGTSIAEIAHRAEVDARTIYKIFGTKVGLLSRLVDVAMVGDQDEGAVMERPWASASLVATTAADRITAFVAAIRGLMERAGPVFRTAAQAAAAEPDAAELWTVGQRLREQDARAFVAALKKASMLRADRTPTHAVATVWLLTSPETYLQFTDGLGWTPAAYERWLQQSLVDALLS